jgi:hypothetical protein
MARIAINAALVEGKLLLDMTAAIQKVRAQLARNNNIMDLTRAGADFTPLGAALGCTATEASTLYSRFRSIETTMNGIDFVNLSDVDQG